MAPDIIERLKASALLPFYPCQIRVHQTLTVLNSNFLQLGRRSGGRPQRRVYPSYPSVSCNTHYVSRHRTHNLPIVSPTRYQYGLPRSNNTLSIHRPSPRLASPRPWVCSLHLRELLRRLDMTTMTQTMRVRMRTTAPATAPATHATDSDNQPPAMSTTSVVATAAVHVVSPAAAGNKTVPRANVTLWSLILINDKICRQDIKPVITS